MEEVCSRPERPRCQRSSSRWSRATSRRSASFSASKASTLLVTRWSCRSRPDQWRGSKPNQLVDEGSARRCWISGARSVKPRMNDPGREQAGIPLESHNRPSVSARPDTPDVAPITSRVGCPHHPDLPERQVFFCPEITRAAADHWHARSDRWSQASAHQSAPAGRARTAQGRCHRG